MARRERLQPICVLGASSCPTGCACRWPVVCRARHMTKCTRLRPAPFGHSGHDHAGFLPRARRCRAFPARSRFHDQRRGRIPAVATATSSGTGSPVPAPPDLRELTRPAIHDYPASHERIDDLRVDPPRTPRRHARGPRTFRHPPGRTSKIAFGKVDQRLLTIKRVVLPSPDADE